VRKEKLGKQHALRRVEDVTKASERIVDKKQKLTEPSQVPPHMSGKEEAEFWRTHEVTREFLEKLERTPEDALPAPRTKPISIRFDQDTLQQLRSLADERGVGYQTLLKKFVGERLSEEVARGSFRPDKFEDYLPVLKSLEEARPTLESLAEYKLVLQKLERYLPTLEKLVRLGVLQFAPPQPTAAAMGHARRPARVDKASRLSSAFGAVDSDRIKAEEEEEFSANLRKSLGSAYLHTSGQAPDDLLAEFGVPGVGKSHETSKPLPLRLGLMN